MVVTGIAKMQPDIVGYALLLKKRKTSCAGLRPAPKTVFRSKRKPEAAGGGEPTTKN